MALLIPLTLPVSLPHQALNLKPAAFACVPYGALDTKCKVQLPFYNCPLANEQCQGAISNSRI